MTKNDVIAIIVNGQTLPPIAKGIIASLIRQMSEAQFEVLITQANSIITSIKSNDLGGASDKLQKLGLPKELIELIMKHAPDKSTIASNGKST